MASQETFRTCYRGNQGPLRHAAYMRMSKVMLLRLLLSRNALDLEGKEIFDYGFGAGTFFRFCPRTSKLHGVELDPTNAAAVTTMLRERGFEHLDLQPMTIEGWENHPLLGRQYDVIVCSHVLEHLPEPSIFLRRIALCLKPEGVFLGLVPINERHADPHHVQIVNRSKIEAWASQAQLHVRDWLETDHWLYWLQPIFTHEAGWRHKCAQVISLLVGLIASIIGEALWFRLSHGFAALTGSRPTQAAFVLQQTNKTEPSSSRSS